MNIIKVNCPQCTAIYELDDLLVGKNAECGKCGNIFIIEKPGERRTLSRKCSLTIDDANEFWGNSVSGGVKPNVSIRPDKTPASTLPGVKPREMKLTDSMASEAEEHDIVILQQIGSGSMGKVHRSRQASVARNVAVKTLDDTLVADEYARSSFIREALVTAALDHPNIVPVHELAIDGNGHLFYSMKELKGKSWELAMSSLSLDENIEIYLKVCDAVAFAHSRGIVHRDLKPANVMIGEFGEVCLVDWGISVAMEDSPLADKAVLRADAGKAGTPAYMAPEMATDEYLNIGCHTDIYLLGAILFEIISGSAPHDSDDVFVSLKMAMNNEFVGTDASGELMNISLKAMADNPKERQSSVIELQKDMQKYRGNRESVKLVNVSETILIEAIKDNSYEKYRQSRAGFIAAYKICAENKEAADGIVKSTEAFAKTAMEKGDMAMAEFLLSSTEGVSKSLRDKAVSEKAAIDRRRRNLKIIQFTTLLFSLFGLVFAYMGMKSFYYLPVHLERIQQELPVRKAEYELSTLEIEENTNRVSFHIADMLKKKMKESPASFSVPDDFLKCASIHDYAVLARTALHLIDEREFDLASKLISQMSLTEFKGWELDHLLFLCSNKDLPRFVYETISMPKNTGYGNMTISPDNKIALIGKSVYRLIPLGKVSDIPLGISSNIFTAYFSQDSILLNCIYRIFPEQKIINQESSRIDGKKYFKCVVDTYSGRIISQQEILVSGMNTTILSPKQISPEHKTLFITESSYDNNMPSTTLRVFNISSGKEIASFSCIGTDFQYISENEIIEILLNQIDKREYNILDIASGKVENMTERQISDKELLKMQIQGQGSRMPEKLDSPDGRRTVEFDGKYLKIYEKTRNILLLQVPVGKNEYQSSRKIDFLKDGVGIITAWIHSSPPAGSSINIAVFPSFGFEKTDMFDWMKSKSKIIGQIKESNPQYDGSGNLLIDEGGKIQEADFHNVKSITDISFLKGHPLKKLSLSHTQVSDLSPLAGMKLESLNLDQAVKVSDLSPIKGMPIKELNLINLRISDISSLKDMPLESLYLWNAPVQDISALKGMPLNELFLINSKVKDLSPLIGIPLKKLLLEASNEVKDISALKSMNTLECLTLPNNPSVDIRLLRSMENIRILDYTGGNWPTKHANEFWKEYDAKGK